jgi:hypothetical protein
MKKEFKDAKILRFLFYILPQTLIFAQNLEEVWVLKA